MNVQRVNGMTLFTVIRYSTVCQIFAKNVRSLTENSTSQQNGDPMTINGVEMSVLPHFQTYHHESNENLDLEL